MSASEEDLTQQYFPWAGHIFCAAECCSSIGSSSWNSHVLSEWWCLCRPVFAFAVWSFRFTVDGKKTIGGKFCGWSRMIPPSIREVFFYIFGWNFDRKCHCFFLGEAFCFIISSIGSTLLTLVLYCIALNAVLTDAERAHRHLRVLPYVGYQMKYFFVYCGSVASDPHTVQLHSLSLNIQSTTPSEIQSLLSALTGKNV